MDSETTNASPMHSEILADVLGEMADEIYGELTETEAAAVIMHRSGVCDEGLVVAADAARLVSEHEMIGVGAMVDYDPERLSVAGGENGN